MLQKRRFFLDFFGAFSPRPDRFPRVYLPRDCSAIISGNTADV